MMLHRETIPLAADEKDAERKKIVAAMQRLFVIEEPEVVTVDERLVIDSLRREAGVTRSALTHRHVDLKDLFLSCVAERERLASNSRSPIEVQLQKQLDDLMEDNRDLHERAIHWESAARDLARTVAALQKLYTTANERLDAVIAEVAHADSGQAANVTPIVNRRHK
ncbi:hypothetical protein [Mycolicibacterium iranicum]|uniref:Uncharacterized protein n=1 Tax=Mycolicibacterium iranicum TaxID=912594 RepID=A0ABT4HL49_MYCIR|nr:hypothetical protein [Mycolicibacterium iranicum]MCZ0730929.1 hypothetical protein [Mycolicibacterium iranicum]